jgi:tetratricopeptide (TPR) repeat protein
MTLEKKEMRLESGSIISAKASEKTSQEEMANLAKPEEATGISEHILQGKRLLSLGDCEGSLREHQKALSLSADRPPGDEALFNMALVYAHPVNPKKDYGKSLSLFKKLMKDYPQSLLCEEARTWISLFEEIEKLNQIIEKSKRIDIEIEEKKREKAK